MTHGSSSGLAFSGTRPTSSALLDRVRRRDQDAWCTFVGLYGPLMHHWIRRSGLSDHDISDVLQNCFASVARSIERFELRPGCSFRAWLWTITRNQLTDYFRQRSEQARASGGSDAWQVLIQVSQSLSDNPDEFTGQTHLTALHQRGLEIVRSEFEQRTWQIFWSVVVEEQSTSEVAAAFNSSANTVRQIKSRVLRRLREVLGEANHSGT